MNHVAVPSQKYYDLLDAVRSLKISEMLAITPLSLARKFVGMREVPGQIDCPQIMAMLRLDAKWPQHDETPWCSAFVNYVAWLAGVERTKSLMARSWLTLRGVVYKGEARPGFDVVVLKRGGADQPGADVINAPGHVGFYMLHDTTHVQILGGNQGDEVSVQRYPLDRVLGYRKLQVMR